MANRSRTLWTKESALQELNRLIEAIQIHQTTEPYSAQYIQWKIETYALLRNVFGEDSVYFKTFNNITWQFSGTMILDIDEMMEPGAGEKKYNKVVYAKALTQALGILSAARSHLDRHALDTVYEGKDTGPEASLILQVIDLAELKLRKVLREAPAKERQVQDAYETLLIGADVPYSREEETTEYSSKMYIPDFVIAKADLAIDLKLSTSPAHEKELIAQINDDILAYKTKYGNVLFIVYDCGQIRDVDRFTASFEAHGSVYIRVVKH